MRMEMKEVFVAYFIMVLSFAIACCGAFWVVMDLKCSILSTLCFAVASRYWFFYCQRIYNRFFCDNLWKTTAEQETNEIPEFEEDPLHNLYMKDIINVEVNGTTETKALFKGGYVPSHVHGGGGGGGGQNDNMSGGGDLKTSLLSSEHKPSGRGPIASFFLGSGPKSKDLESSPSLGGARSSYGGGGGDYPYSGDNDDDFGYDNNSEHGASESDYSPVPRGISQLFMTRIDRADPEGKIVVCEGYMMKKVLEKGVFSNSEAWRRLYFVLTRCGDLKCFKSGREFKKCVRNNEPDKTRPLEVENYRVSDQPPSPAFLALMESYAKDSANSHEREREDIRQQI